ncbi:MAG: MmgE/PrpD family protein [Pseudomonadota bacterium]
MTIAASLAQLVTRTPYHDLPSLAVDHAAMIISSTIASAAAGYGIASSEIIRALAKEQGGTPESSVWFDSGPKLPAVNACRVNAVMSDAAASDDSDLRNIVHLGTQLTSSTLALGERTNASGKDVLAAVVLGYETAGRIGEAIMPAYRNLGFHGCIVATFGAAVASARMLNLNQQQMTQAIAIAAVSTGGLATAADTSVAREYFAGNAALMGMNAALAAQKGYLIEERILETSKGYFDVYGGEDLESITRDWGKAWDIVTDMAIKLVPGGHPSHAIAEAAVSAAREGNVSADEVETITIARPLSARLRIGAPSAPSHPKNLVEVAHTPAYFAAAAVADKDFSWVHASAQKIFDPVIHQLIDKVRIGDPVTQDAEKFRHGAVVTIKTRDGRSYTSTVYTPRGSGVRGIDWSDVDNKYRTLVAMTNLNPRKIEDGIEVIHELRDVQDVSKLTSLLR